jgi:hypothetical protein
MKSLLVTGAHHRAVCALYEKQLEQQRADWKDDLAAGVERERAAELRVQELHLKVLELMTAKETRPAGPGQPRRKERIKVPEAVDASDTKQVFAQAVAEVGGGSANRVLRRMDQIRTRLRPHGPPTQTFSRPSQADVQAMIDNAEYTGLTMPPIPAAEVN